MTIQWIKWRILKQRFNFGLSLHQVSHGDWNYCIPTIDTINDTQIYQYIYKEFIQFNEPPYYDGFEWEFIDSPPPEYIAKEIFLCKYRIDKDQEYLSKLQETLHPIDFHDNCPKCRRPMLLFSSFQYKQCVECGQKYDWKLKPMQQPLVKHQR